VIDVRSGLDVALATCAGLPDLDADDAPLVTALAALGLRAAPVRWDDERFDWSSARACVIRSTWDYHERRAAFVAWAERAGRVTRLLNDADTVRWNTHKGYLRELEARGVAIVPTAWVLASGARGGEDRERGERGERDVSALLNARGWDDAVIKPAVSANARDTIRVRGARDRAKAQAHLEAILARGGDDGDAMIQPYLSSVEARGERSLVFFDGLFSHAIRKHPQLGHDGAAGAGAGIVAVDGQGRAGGEPPADADDDEVTFALGVLAAAKRDTLYARVDIARDAAGAIALMELELTEPSLFLAKGKGAVERFAASIAVRARAA
jgi:hypothetical protein